MIGLKTGHKGTHVREISAPQYLNALARHLEESKVITAPDWADLLKTSCINEMPPSDPKWWYMRSAAIARQVYLHPGTSVSELRNHFGAGQRNGTAPNHFRQAAKKIIRFSLQQLEKAGLMKIVDGKGRVLTAKGQKVLDSIAASAAKTL